MIHAHTVAALIAALFLPALAAAQSANAKPAPGSPTAEQLPIYEIDPTWPPTLPNDWILGQVSGIEQKDGKLSELRVTGADGVTRRVPLDMLLVFFGLSPKLGPIAQWGLDIERKQLKVDTEKFSTNVPGIFAVGDINTYPGKKKLILSGFHECALAAFGAAPCQCSTLSPRHLRLISGRKRTAVPDGSTRWTPPTSPGSMRSSHSNTTAWPG